MGCTGIEPSKPKFAIRPNSKRKGCWTCKRYHRKCDENVPFCRRCSEYGVECEGYGAQRVAFRSHAPQARVGIRRPRASISKPPRSLSPVGNLPTDQQILLSDFLTSFATSRALSPLHNFYRDDIAPLVLGHPHLRSAVLALTSAYKNPDNKLVSAFKYYEEAVRVFRSSFGKEGELHANLASIFLLAWFEMLVFDPQKWVTHLKGACTLINNFATELWQTTFGRRLIHAIARLDCPNALSARSSCMLEPSVYRMLETQQSDFDVSNIEEYTVDACRRLHGIIGAATFLSDEWVWSHQISESFRTRAHDVLDRLNDWYDGFSLHINLQWTDDKKELMQWPKLLKVVLLQYFTTKVHIYHMLDPLRSGLWDISVELSKKCLALVKALGSPADLVGMQYRGDMSVAFTFAVVGVLIENEDDKQWIKEYLFQLGRETVWCGYERAMCLQAWWQSTTPGKRLIMSKPQREEASWNWTPDVGMTVGILYENMETGEIGCDSYFMDRSITLPAARKEITA